MTLGGSRAIAGSLWSMSRLQEGGWQMDTADDAQFPELLVSLEPFSALGIFPLVLGKEGDLYWRSPQIQQLL